MLIRQANPDMPVAPDYLRPPLHCTDYTWYRAWMHYAEGWQATLDSFARYVEAKN